MILDTTLCVSGSKAGRGVGHGGGRGITNKGKLDSRGRNEELSSRAETTCNHCQKPGPIRPNVRKCQCLKYKGWGHEAVSCPSQVPIPKGNGEKEKRDESDVMAVDQDPVPR